MCNNNYQNFHFKFTTHLPYKFIEKKKREKKTDYETFSHFQGKTFSVLNFGSIDWVVILRQFSICIKERSKTLTVNKNKMDELLTLWPGGPCAPLDPGSPGGPY